MGLFHLANCLVLATGPHLLVYKSNQKMMLFGPVAKLHALLEIIVITMIVRGSICRSEFNVVASSVGWSIASLVATRYVPIWVGTRGLEFDWKYLCLSYEANLDLVRMHIMLFDSFRLIHL
ncbi:unnamed protein product [Schistosoma margrebowiei]|uniref:BOS complex subunit TMEM147 n=1 Tax=Schistosoma margrebowiei TaxID=48269 RepID=A0A183N5G0_9TREM|nr:unnamed protein product [Schistosoma margrebowiei]